MQKTDTAKPSAFERALYDIAGKMPVLFSLSVIGTIALLFWGMIVQPSLAVTAMIILPLLGLAVWFFWTRPEYSSIALIGLAASFFATDRVDIRLPIGGLDLLDLAFLGLLGLMLLRKHMQRDLDIALPWWSFSGPMVLFAGTVLLSVVYAVVFSGVAPNVAFNEARPLVFFMAFFITAWSIESKRQFWVAIIGMYILADITGLILIGQQFAGRDNEIISTLAGNWRIEGNAEFGEVRVLPPGHVMMYFMMVLGFCLGLFARDNWRLQLFGIGQFVFLNLAMLFTYSRSQWAVSLLAVGLIGLIVPWVQKKRIVALGGYAALALLVLTLLFGNALWDRIAALSFLDALHARFTSIFTPDETLNSHSLEWRIYENGEAFRSISENPVFGIGLGANYRDVTLLQRWTLGMDERFLKYIHNSYLYITVKMGYIGIGLFAWMITAFLIGTFLFYWRMPDDWPKGFALAMGVGMIGLLVWANTFSHFMSAESTVVVGIIAGLLASLRPLVADKELL